ncbi:hypothetical protein JKF63_07762 [Porcisia hertigi]|uniref:Uncharacterized protein n=1 Tax=Porcisia hertigi TaxID=2761500 RepID=A0A836YJV5_9TRYP|nr:hypothetical protein JKF63_07762 [Porcisia hertigi]
MRQLTYQAAAFTATTSLAIYAASTSLRSCCTGSREERRGAAASATSSSFSASHRPSSAPPRHARPVGGRGPVKDRFPPVPTDLADPRRRLAVLVDGSNPNLIPGSCTTADQVYRTSSLFNTVLPAVLQVGVPVLLRIFAHQLPAIWEPLLAGSTATTHGTSASASDSVPTDSAGHPIPILLPLPPLSSPLSSATSASPPQAAAAAVEEEAAVITPHIQLDYFRVERFIPLAMQIEADARHLYEFRHTNKLEGVCYVCHEVDRAMYISLMQEQRTGSADLEGLLREVNHTGQEGGPSVQEERATSAAFFNQYVLDELGMAGELLTDARSKNGA